MNTAAARPVPQTTTTFHFDETFIRVGWYGF
jgi:hypothetical protein